MPDSTYKIPLPQPIAGSRISRDNLLSTDADPDHYSYHEFSALALGKTFSPNDVTVPKYPSISFTAEKLDPGPPYTGASMYYVKTFDQLNYALGIDAKASASVLKSKASVHYNFKTSGMFQQSTILAVINARTDYGRWGLKAGLTLDAHAKELLSNPRKFAEVCGTRYVAIERRSSAVSVIVQIEYVSTEVKASLDADFETTGGWGLVSATAQSKINTELKHASAQDRASIQIGSTGGPGFGELHAAISALLSKDQQSDKIGAALSDYLAKFCEKNAVATQFDVRSMADFGFDENGLDPWTDLQEKFLRLLVSEYRVTTEALDLNQSIDEGTSPLAKLLPPFVLEDMKNEIPRLLKYQADLASMHHDVKANSGNSLPPGLPASKMRSSALVRIENPTHHQIPSTRFNHVSASGCSKCTSVGAVRSCEPL